MTLIARLAKHFATSETFVAKTLDRKVNSDFSGAHNLASLRDSLTPQEYKGVHYTLNSNRRGALLVERAQKHGLIAPDAKRALDIGAGYGGLTAAMADAGLDAVGVEIEDTYVQMAEDNLEGRKADVRAGNILDSECEALGKFDFITCSNVIEHVDDVDELFAKVSDLLNSGGVGLFEVPNFRAIDNVIGDVHHRIFGIQLLHYSAAKRSHAFNFSPDQPYTIGEMFTLDRYFLMARRAGFSTEKLPYEGELPGDAVLFTKLATLAAQSEELATSDKYDWFLRTEIIQKCANYIASFSQGLADYVIRGSPSFIEDYVEPVWAFAIRKAG